MNELLFLSYILYHERVVYVKYSHRSDSTSSCIVEASRDTGQISTRDVAGTQVPI